MSISLARSIPRYVCLAVSLLSWGCASGWQETYSGVAAAFASARQGGHGAAMPLAIAGGYFHAGAQSASAPIAGPLPVGTTARSGDLVVQQLTPEVARISLHGSRIEISGDAARGQRYTFHVDPQSNPRQRVMRIAGTLGVVVTRHLDDNAPQQLVCHERYTRDPTSLDTAPIAAISGSGPDSEFVTVVRYSGRVLARVSVEVDGNGVVVDTNDMRARFAHDLAPDWTGPGATERAVRIVATPGVRVSSYARGDAGPRVSYGRKPVPDLVYVQDPRLIPGPGQPVEVSRFLTTRAYLGTYPGHPRSSLLVTHGRAGVTIREVVTGALVRIHSGHSDTGARFVYDIATPARQGGGGGRTKIRVLVDKRALVEVFEPRTRPILGTETGDSLGDMNVELIVYRAVDSALVPAQGTTLTREFLRSVGTQVAPDAHHYGIMSAGQTAALAVSDTLMSAVPGAGDAVDIAELGKAIATGKDRYGRPVSNVELAIMGIAAVLPLVGPGALRLVGKGARAPAALAARLGRTVDEMDALLARAQLLTGQDRAAIARIHRALRTGARVDPQDIRHVRQSLDQLGFVIDLAPTHGDVFLFPELGPGALGRWGDGAESAESAALHNAGKRGIGAARPPRHHVLPREHRKWFEERGFVGERDIDNYTVEMSQADHQALHGGGNWRLGRSWPGEWNRVVMRELKKEERKLQHKLQPDEILEVVEELMVNYRVRGPFVPYKSK